MHRFDFEKGTATPPAAEGNELHLHDPVEDLNTSRRALALAVTTQVSAGSNSGTPRLYHFWLYQFVFTGVFQSVLVIV